MLKLADTSELGWKVVSEYQAIPKASNLDDERKIYKAEVGAGRKARTRRKGYVHGNQF